MPVSGTGSDSGMGIDPELLSLQRGQAQINSEAPTLQQSLHEAMAGPDETEEEMHKANPEPVVKIRAPGSKRTSQGRRSQALKAQREKQAFASRKKTMISGGVAAALILLLGVFAFNISSRGGFTGFAVADEPAEKAYPYNAEFTSDTQTTLEFQKVLGLSISGQIEGPGAIVRLKAKDREYLVADIKGSGSAQTYTLTTNKRQYTPGEQVRINLTPAPESVSLYVQHGDGNSLINSYSYTPNETGEYSIIAVVTTANDILRLSVNMTISNASGQDGPGDVATATESGASGTFTGLCDESCLLQEEEAGPILVVELQEGTVLRLTELIVLESEEDLPPIQRKTFGDVSLKTGESINLVLNDYFTDPDGTRLSYDISQLAGVSTDIANDDLTITGNVAGEYTAHVYASDGLNLLTGNDFRITVGDGVTTGVNGTGNSLPPAQNQSQNTNGTAANESGANETPPSEVISGEFGNCDDPNPNRRPLSCIEGSESEYFTPRQILLEDRDRLPVGRVTTFGNLIITGVLVEGAQGSPSGSDFRISYLSNDLETEITTAWIDSSSGNLYLKGSIHEEQLDLVPPSVEAFLMQNQKGTTLGYFDRRSGDLYLRGNLITEKPEVEQQP